MTVDYSTVSARMRACRCVVAMISVIAVWISGPTAARAASCGTPHQCFVLHARQFQPILHVDLTDGMFLENFNLAFGYQPVLASAQPRFTCNRYQNYGDGKSCASYDAASVLQLTPYASINHIDYPAGFNSDCAKKAFDSSSFGGNHGTLCEQELMARNAWNGQPVMYVFGRKHALNGWKSFAYWFFYSYNDFVASFNLGVTKVQQELDLHEGDLEHVVVYVDANYRPQLYRFYEHSGYTDFRPGDPAIDAKDGHVRVYAAAGSHASEPHCGLFTNNVEPQILGSRSQRDRACAINPYKDDASHNDGSCKSAPYHNVCGTPAATATYAPNGGVGNGTKLSNLDVLDWACFGDKLPNERHRLGASHQESILGQSTGGDAPSPPLEQANDAGNGSNDCPNLWERQHAASTTGSGPAPPASAPTAVAQQGQTDPGFIDPPNDASEEPTSSVVDGADRCSDWEKPAVDAGQLNVVVCNQDMLQQFFSEPVPQLPANAPVITAPDGSPVPGGDIPASAQAPSAAALGADGITAPAPLTADVYVSEPMPNDTGTFQAVFHGMPLSSSPLHVNATGSTWTITDSTGQVLGSAAP